MIEWFNENEGRAYPFVDAGKQGIPDELVVDLVLSGPAEQLDGAYLSSIVVRHGLVSLSISGPEGGLAVFTAANPETYVPHGMTPIKDGIGGYVTFGLAVDMDDLELDRRNMTDFPVMVDPGCLRALDGLVVDSVGKLDVREEDHLRGIVNLFVSQNMTLSRAGSTIYIGLKDDDKGDFVSKCDRSAVFDECGKPPIRKISGVGPDEDGVLYLEFKNDA